MIRNTEVVVIGGGYAGVMAANRLTQRTDVAVTLVNARPNFVERIRLHQYVAGSGDAGVEFGEVLADRVRLVVDTATRINPSERSISLRSVGELGYDYLVYALGSGRADFRVPGAEGFSYPISTFEDAERLRRALDAADVQAPVAVVGAGPTGIEVAAELAERGRAVTLVCGDRLGPYLHPRARRSVSKRLARLGVVVLEGPGSTATAIKADSVELSDNRQVASEVTIWTAGFGVPDLARRSGLSTDAVGRLRTDEALVSVDDARIVGAGDAVAPSDLPFRMSCQAAGPLGAHAADTVLRMIAGERPGPIGLGFVGQCISLGRRNGIVQVAHRDDSATKLHIGGRAAAKVKEFVCWGTVKGLSIEAKKPGSFKWEWARDRTRKLALEAKLLDAAATVELPPDRARSHSSST